MINFINQKQKRNRYHRTGLLTGLFLLCLQQNALAEPPLEKVHLAADHMWLNIETGTSIYTGHVKISQGELILTGDKVTVVQKENEIERIVVIGKPARYNHVMEDGGTVKAESERMVYIASKNKLIMTINASLQQPDNLVKSQRITYDTVKRTIIAGSKNKKKEKQRVNITLTPKNKNQPTNKPSAK